MIQPILKRGDYRLRTPCREVDDIELAQPVITDLWDTLTAIQGLYNFTRGSGLAAPQIGRGLRISVVEYAGEQYTLVNPRLVAHSEEKAPIREGCLSFFDYRGMPLRWTGVTVEAQDAAGETYRLNCEGDFASLVQHEIGHLNGVLYDTKLSLGEELVIVPGMPSIP